MIKPSNRISFRKVGHDSRDNVAGVFVGSALKYQPWRVIMLSIFPVNWRNTASSSVKFLACSRFSAIRDGHHALLPNNPENVCHSSRSLERAWRR